MVQNLSQEEEISEDEEREGETVSEGSEMNHEDDRPTMLGLEEDDLDDAVIERQLHKAGMFQKEMAEKKRRKVDLLRYLSPHTPSSLLNPNLCSHAGMRCHGWVALLCSKETGPRKRNIRGRRQSEGSSGIECLVER